MHGPSFYKRNDSLNRFLRLALIAENNSLVSKSTTHSPPLDSLGQLFLVNPNHRSNTARPFIRRDASIPPFFSFSPFSPKSQYSPSQNTVGCSFPSLTSYIHQGAAKQAGSQQNTSRFDQFPLASFIFRKRPDTRVARSLSLANRHQRTVPCALPLPTTCSHGRNSTGTREHDSVYRSVEKEREREG